jgi:hypothetical protein
MYATIEKFQETIINAVVSEDVSEYDWLIQNLGSASTGDYQQKYKSFWTMNVARLSGSFHTAYFSALCTAQAQAQALVLGGLCRMLYESSTRSNGVKTLQFSFATKLLHMVNPRLPIYDSRIARFYLFQEPSADQPLERRIDGFCAFYSFLANEYARIIASGQLGGAIASFRQRLAPQKHTDEKILDWLIWTFVGRVDDGALLNGQVVYV